MKRFLRVCALILCLMTASTALAVEPGFLVRHGDRSVPKIAITVDDCYDEIVLRKMYELMLKEDVPFTFFILGKALDVNDKEVWEGILAAGGEVGSHSLWHHSLPSVDRQYAFNMIKMTQQYWDELLGYHYPLRILRPPYGKYSGRLDVIEAAGIEKVIMWDVSNTDARGARGDVQNGSILLYHTNYKDLECLETLIPQLKEDGYEMVTVSELLGMEPIQTSEEPFVYHKN